MIVTIGREYGSGGRLIGRALAKKMGVPFYDKEILTRAAQESGLCPDVFERNDEKTRLSQFLTGTSYHNGAPVGAQMPINQRVFLAQFETISRIAEEGDCVIVGRCADYVLRERGDVFHVFLYAGEAKRTARIMEVEGCDENKARDLIRKTDRERKNYYNFFADGNWGNRCNYDLMLRTDGLTPEEAAELILAAAEKKTSL